MMAKNFMHRTPSEKQHPGKRLHNSTGWRMKRGSFKEVQACMTMMQTHSGTKLKSLSDSVWRTWNGKARQTLRLHKYRRKIGLPSMKKQRGQKRGNHIHVARLLELFWEK
jgi:hypothetical protein